MNKNNGPRRRRKEQKRKRKHRHKPSTDKSKLEQPETSTTKWVPNLLAREWTPEKTWKDPVWEILPTKPPVPPKAPKHFVLMEVADLVEDLVEQVTTSVKLEVQRKRIRRLHKRWKRHLQQRKENASKAVEASEKPQPLVANTTRPMRQPPPTTKLSEPEEESDATEEVEEVEEVDSGVLLDAILNGDFTIIFKWYNSCITTRKDVGKELNGLESRTGLLLWNTIKQGDHSILAFLLDHGFELPKCTGPPNLQQEKKSCLHLICENGKDSMLLTALNHISTESKLLHVNLKDSNGNSPLHVACESGSVACVDLLIRRGANCQTKNKDKCSPLHIAVGSGNETIVDRLLRVTKISLGAKNAEGHTALQIAVCQGNVLCLVSLLNHGAMSLEEGEASSIMTAAAKYGNSDVMRVLLDKFSDSDTLLECMKLAIVRGHFDMLKLMLETERVELNNYGVDNFEVSKSHIVLLVSALMSGRWSIVEYLILEKDIKLPRTWNMEKLFRQILAGVKRHMLPLETLELLLSERFHPVDPGPINFDQIVEFQLCWRQKMNTTIRTGIPSSQDHSYLALLRQLMIFNNKYPTQNNYRLDEKLVGGFCLIANPKSDYEKRKDLPEIHFSEAYVKMFQSLTKEVSSEQRSSGCDRVRVVLQSGRTVYPHLSFVRARCKVFEAMFAHGMAEEAANSFKWTDYGDDAVLIVLEYLYTGRATSLEETYKTTYREDCKMLDTLPDVGEIDYGLRGRESKQEGGVTDVVWDSWWVEVIGERISYLETQMEVAKKKIAHALEIFACADHLMLGSLMTVAMSCVYSLFEFLIRMRLHLSSFLDTLKKEQRVQQDGLGSEAEARKLEYTSKSDDLMVELMNIAVDLVKQASFFSDIVQRQLGQVNKFKTSEKKKKNGMPNTANVSGMMEATMKVLEDARSNPENFVEKLMDLLDYIPWVTQKWIESDSKDKNLQLDLIKFRNDMTGTDVLLQVNPTIAIPVHSYMLQYRCNSLFDLMKEPAQPVAWGGESYKLVVDLSSEEYQYPETAWNALIDLVYTDDSSALQTLSMAELRAVAAGIKALHIETKPIVERFNLVVAASKIAVQSCLPFKPLPALHLDVDFRHLFAIARVLRTAPENFVQKEECVKAHRKYFGREKINFNGEVELGFLILLGVGCGVLEY